MRQQFFFGELPATRSESIDTSAIKTPEELKGVLGQLFSFADPSCSYPS
jgi:hypothetical protein